MTEERSDKIKQEARLNIGHALRGLREAMNLSQEALAEKVGIKRSNIARIEGGKYNVTLDTLAVIANALDCNINFCINDADSLPDGAL